MESIEIDKTIQINIDCVRCDCGKYLEFSLSSDSYNDIHIEVEKHICVDSD